MNKSEVCRLFCVVTHPTLDAFVSQEEVLGITDDPVRDAICKDANDFVKEFPALCACVTSEELVDYYFSDSNTH